MGTSELHSDTLNDELFRQHEALIRAELEQYFLRQPAVPNAPQDLQLFLIRESSLDRSLLDLQIPFLLFDVEDMLGLVCLVLGEVHFCVFLLCLSLGF